MVLRRFILASFSSCDGSSIYIDLKINMNPCVRGVRLTVKNYLEVFASNLIRERDCELYTYNGPFPDDFEKEGLLRGQFKK